MITITITSDVPLTDPRMDLLLHACTTLGVDVCVKAELVIAANYAPLKATEVAMPVELAETNIWGVNNEELTEKILNGEIPMSIIIEDTVHPDGTMTSRSIEYSAATAHRWPDFTPMYSNAPDQSVFPSGMPIDDESSAQYVGSGVDDGWIDVDRGCGIKPNIPETATVDIKLECGDILHDRYAAESNWGWPMARERVITAYRLHKPEVKAPISTTESMLLKDQAN